MPVSLRKRLPGVFVLDTGAGQMKKDLDSDH